MNFKSSPSLALLMEMFPGRANLNFIEAALALGLAQQTAYNLVNQKKFPVPTFKEGKARYCSILDLAAKLDDQRGITKRRPGRPTNAERAARLELKAGGDL